MDPDEVPPPIEMVKLLSGFQISQALYVVGVLGVPDQLVGGPRRAEEVAAAVGAEPEVLRRLLRTLASVGVFSQVDDETYGLTPLGQTITSTSPGSVLDFLIMVVEVGYPVFGQLLHTARTGQPAAEHVHGEAFFSWLAKDPEKAERFTRAMENLTSGVRLGAIPSIDVAGAKTVVDVGGANGSMLIEVLGRNPDVRGIVFDLAHVIPAAEQNLKLRGLDDRVEAISGNFFESVPAGDTYLFGFILHGWSDDECVRILGNVRAAGTPGARVRAVEFVVPTGPEPHMAKMMDLAMLAMATGKERTEPEWQALFTRAGFRLERVVPTPTPVSILEAVAD